MVPWRSSSANSQPPAEVWKLRASSSRGALTVRLGSSPPRSKRPPSSPMWPPRKPLDPRARRLQRRRRLALLRCRPAPMQRPRGSPAGAREARRQRGTRAAPTLRRWRLPRTMRPTLRRWRIPWRALHRQLRLRGSARHRSPRPPATSPAPRLRALRTASRTEPRPSPQRLCPKLRKATLRGWRPRSPQRWRIPRRALHRPLRLRGSARHHRSLASSPSWTLRAASRRKPRP
mmetsp:Transcript_42025/g.116974  ORF Transcript_42025/g.116974 Transcript_42025/m.116974 type:complete len:232 (-) Transcript_42025:797-1492(-)